MPASSMYMIVIPTYNEKANIVSLIETIFSVVPDFHITIVDDNSPDGTGRIADELAQTYPAVHVIHRPDKQGLGTAYVAGFQYALDAGAEYIFEMDADFSHNPDDLINLYNAAANEGADAVIGSRYINGVNVVNWPMGRVLMSYYASTYVRFVTGLKIMDTTAGFMCWTRKVLETIDLDSIKFVGYAFQIEMKYTASKLGFNVVEVPIIFTDRTEGTSKMNKSIFREAIFGILDLRFRNIVGKIKPIKTF